MVVNVDDTAHQATMVATYVLFLKFLVTVMIQGGKRFAGGSRPPEDVKLSLSKKYKAKQTYGTEPSENPEHAMADIRWQRIVHNDLENVVVGLVLAWASLFSAYNSSLHVWSVVVFTSSRLLHTYFYAYEMQPHRGIAWTAAVLAMLTMGTNGVLGVF